MDNMKENKSAWECGSDRWTAAAEGLLPYACTSCGSVILAQKEDRTGICPFCESRLKEKTDVGETFRPDAVIPFQMSRERAEEKYREYAATAKFLPDEFLPERLGGALHGVYIPVWLFDSRVQYNARAQAENDEITSTETRNKKVKTVYYTTNHYSVLGSGHVAFENVPADASRAMPDEFMKSVEPFYLSDMVPFQKDCLSGYGMAHYDVMPDEVLDGVENRLLLTLRKNRSQVFKEYQRVLLEDDSMKPLAHKVRYALMPVWLLNIRWNNQWYPFAINGQTGKMAGDFPIDFQKVRKTKLWRFLAIAGAAAALAVFIFFVW